ncbi:acyl-CoA dehydrogenase family protein [Nocardia mangyaensis]|uniref:acyl-CoA dehydrogenase family protein n=1 Tax=Nocardia mangyaensis TaxID=2213200 RepID=UPI0026763C61|nr:acyl-CoA dehydrogenase family protein [Nocardia mangyaensis]MDO3647466.1 acyl-CoA dehydrogenase family protein [Nocardia mangyaensis]
MNASVFDFLLTTEPDDAPGEDLAAGWARHRARSAGFANSVDRAAIAGFDSAETGSAFLGGYQEALHALVPELEPDDLAALCATEAAGARPSAMTTTVAGDGTVTGTKSFATLGPAATRFVVIATEGLRADGRSSLRAVLVPAAAPGITVTPLPELPFVPEVPHATVEFTAAPGDVLPGDGYADYLKPFRTVEDMHVVAAVLGRLVRVGRQARWPVEPVAQLLAVLAAVRGVSVDDPNSAGAHVALGGVFGLLTRARVELEPWWDQVDPVVRSRWDRDSPVLGVAGKARAARLTTAWRAVAGAE